MIGKKEEAHQVIYVQMLGGFSLTMGDKFLDDKGSRSRKAWNLLSYLIYKRKEPVSFAELSGVIWREDEEENPGKALKTLVFRVRRMLEEAGFPAQELIVSYRGAYQWNPQWETVTDTDRFEKLYFKGMGDRDKKKGSLAECQEAFSLYRGKFLPRAERWAYPPSSYYHSLYEKLVPFMADRLIREGSYGKAEELCSRAISVDPFAEDFYYCWIYAICCQGRQTEAMRRYREAGSFFYQEGLMTPSEHFEDLYRIISDTKTRETASLEEIYQSLCEEGDRAGRGAYRCEFIVFKQLIQLERRSMERSGDSVYLCLLTVRDRNGEILKPEIQTRAMERLQTALEYSIRACDAYSRYSVSQLLLLLCSATYEDSRKVAERILSAYSRSYTRKDVKVTFSLEALVPIKAPCLLT